ncbi:MAG TPA: protein ndvB, partial [Pseudorhizobium sp.]|nr:protein ndvB [Pseudorhizobium sp.]
EKLRRMGQMESGRPHVFTLRRDLMDDATFDAIIASARVVLHARNGKLIDQLNRAISLFAAPLDVNTYQRPLLNAEHFKSDPADDGEGLQFWNGFGGFDKDGAEYVIRLRGGQSTPHPWINVIANDRFGFHVAAEGGGYTWSQNSRDYQLTPWSNDPVINRPVEAFYIRDRNSDEVVSPFAALAPRSDTQFETRHGLGYSIFSTSDAGLTIRLTQTVDRERPVKLSILRVKNEGSEPRQLRLYGYVEWLLGNNAERSLPFIITSADEDTGALLATNAYSTRQRRFAFFAASEPLSSFTASRRDFIGRFGSIAAPTAVTEPGPLAGTTGVDGNPCAAIACDVELAPGEEKVVTFFLGDAEDQGQALELVRSLQTGDVTGLLDESREYWRSFTGRLKVDTPDPGLNYLVNHWLPYQALGCRITARSAFYQASGAYGFRDQLQDTLAFLLQQPDLARRQIINAAARQFLEGDVQHWWLPESGAGVRTRISDDVVWFAHAAHEYVTATDDESLLDEEVSFLLGPALDPKQHDSFFTPEVSSETATLYEHAARALDLAVERTGERDLPLILGGDWNDGMNRVGIEGRGTSVWLGWFLAGTLRSFVGHAKERGDQARVDRWGAHVDRLQKALETAGWDGAYYRRGYFDDGSPLGASESKECRIDSLSQSWSVLSGLAGEDRASQAMDAVVSELVDEERGIIRLFTPPFAETPLDPGYIKAYPPGVRENGGQYTHAATWVVLALARLGRADDAWRCFQLLNPINHSRNAEAAETYRVEPYVVAADVYGEGSLAGRGGWTWYTGSAGWLYRVAVEAILGIRRQGTQLLVQPALPSDWNGYSADLTIDDHLYSIRVERDPTGEIVTKVNGEVIGAEGAPLRTIPFAPVRQAAEG